MNRRSYMLLMAAGAGLLLIGGRSAGYTFGERDTSIISRDPNRLAPDFARAIEKLFRAMRARGFDPMLYEGYRTPARAAQLAAKGTGIVDSMHSYGAAVDIVSRTKMWNDPPFYKALGEEAEKLGLTWGGRFSNVDGPHVQAIPVAMQNQIRTAAAPNDVVHKYLAAA